MAQVPERSELITSLDEARAYYRARLVGAHKITCHGRPVTVVFERKATHLFSDAPTGGMRDLTPAEQRAVFDSIPAELRVERRLPKGRIEVRTFNLERAQLMDRVLPAVSAFTVSVPGTGRRGRENRLLHGPALADGRYMRVVLQPGPSEAFTCLSAYPVDREAWLAARRAKSAKFPP